MLAAPVGSVTEDALRAWGELLGATVSVPAVLALRGDLGAGKTTLAQAIARGAGVVDDVTSPTFALVHQYDSARGVVAHLDLYRLKAPDDLYALGWDDILRTAAIVIVEWPERAGALLPAARADIALAEERDDPDHRMVQVTWTA
jgi:tRNA threonylcarbamoyladenosine biosynthesis protein TsaE